MNLNLSLLFFICLGLSSAHGQDGRILSKERLLLPDSVSKRIAMSDPALYADLKKIDLYRITYESDRLQVVGFIAEPKAPGKYPCVISNRGGRHNFSLWKPYSLAYYLCRIATWGYVVAASQYRGSIDGSQGKDEFGGKDVNDIFNLIPVLSQISNADTSRIGLDSHSRGGMMTYLALKRSCRFRAAVIVAGLSDLFDNIEKRPELEDLVYRDLMPDYSNKKTELLTQRSAVFWPEKICKTTPLLVMHGSADWRVSPEQSLRLVEKLYENKVPVRYILFEGGDHDLKPHHKEMFSESKRHFDYYLRDGHSLPSLEPGNN